MNSIDIDNFNEVRYASSRALFVYDLDDKIIRKIQLFEDDLKDNFTTPFKLLSLPDENDTEADIFESSTPNSHSILRFSQEDASIITSYDSNYENDINKIKSYFTEKSNTVFKTLNKFEKIKSFILGMKFMYILPDKDKTFVNDFIKKESGLNLIDKNTYTIDYNYVKVIDEYVFDVGVTRAKLMSEKENTEKDIILLSLQVGLSSKNRDSCSSLDTFNKLRTRFFDVLTDCDLTSFMKGDLV